MRRLLAALALPCALLASPAIAQDSDQDGANDAVDLFPCDATRAAVTYLPGATTFGTIMVENNWPQRGDLDFNDAVLAYNYAVFSNSAGGVTAIVLTLDPLALGAHFDDGVALRLPVPRAALSNASIAIGAGAPAALSANAGETDVVVTIAANMRDWFPGSVDFVNTAPATALQDAALVRVTLEFAGGVGLNVGADPFDLFFFKAETPGRQVHRPQFDGTATMDRTYLNTGDDASTATRHFIDSSGLPYVLSMPVLVRWTNETTTIDRLFPDIVGFASSGGVNNRNFYASTVVTANAWAGSANGGNAATLMAPAAASRACLPETCNGVDDNGDGVVDEGNPGGGVACTTALPGICAAGVSACSAGAIVCNANNAAGTEVCNGLDDDCDGATDEVYANAESHFGSGVGGWTILNDGTNIRVENGALVVDDLGDGTVWYFVAPAAFTGDFSSLYGGVISFRQRVSVQDSGVDNDSIVIIGANGVTMQRGLPSAPTSSWNTYTFPVVAGGWVNSSGATLSEAQIRAVLANVSRIRIRGEYSGQLDVGYIDDIFFGATDPRFGSGGGAACSTGQLGVCAAGNVTCSGGAMVCVRATAPVAESCNALDDDCDGSSDEGNPGGGQSCSTGQLGVCAAGTTQCGSGAVSCVRNVAPTTEACNLVDDDCDGQTDEGCAYAESHFDATTEGWTFDNDGGNVRLTSGALTITDQGVGTVWGFVAPAAFTGDLSTTYGGSLSYRFRVSSRNLTGTDMVSITGANGVTMQRSTAYPTTSFTTFTLPLVTGSWINASGGATLSEAQIRAILANVTRLRIRGEWADNIDTGYLDDVVLTRGP